MATRDRNIYISRAVFSALLAIARSRDCTADEVADTMLRDLLKEKQEQVMAFYEKHEEAEKALMMSLKPTNQNHP